MQRRNGGFRSRPIIILAILSAIVMVVMIVKDYSPPSSSVFSVHGYYKTPYVSEKSAKELYNEMNPPLGYGDAACQTVMTKGEDLSSLGRYTWIVDGQEIDSLGSVKRGANSDVLVPYEDGDYIISPADTNTFINSNLGPFYCDGISIAIKTGKYIVRWDDVESWWCHINRENPTKHTERIGSSGICSQCYKGYIIGQAKSTTTVSFFEISEDGSEVQISPEIYFGVN